MSGLLRPLLALLSCVVLICCIISASASLAPEPRGWSCDCEWCRDEHAARRESWEQFRIEAPEELNDASEPQ